MKLENLSPKLIRIIYDMQIDNEHHTFDYLKQLDLVNDETDVLFYTNTKNDELEFDELELTPFSKKILFTDSNKVINSMKVDDILSQLTIDDIRVLSDLSSYNCKCSFEQLIKLFNLGLIETRFVNIKSNTINDIKYYNIFILKENMDLIDDIIDVTSFYIDIIEPAIITDYLSKYCYNLESINNKCFDIILNFIIDECKFDYQILLSTKEKTDNNFGLFSSDILNTFELLELHEINIITLLKLCVLEKKNSNSCVNETITNSPNLLLNQNEISNSIPLLKEFSLIDNNSKLTKCGKEALTLYIQEYLMSLKIDETDLYIKLCEFAKSIDCKITYDSNSIYMITLETHTIIWTLEFDDFYICEMM
jgi:hypothetical protein